MSFVSVFGNSQFMNVVSDGRVTNGKNIVDENYVKFKKISTNQFIAFAGARELCEGIIKQIPLKPIGGYELSQLSNSIHSAIYKEENFRPFKMLFCVGGIGNLGNIEFYTIDKDNSQIQKYEPLTTSDIKYAYLASDSLNNVNLEEKIYQYAEEFGVNNASNLLDIQKSLNNYVAGLDFTVNKNTFHWTIYK